MKILIIEDEYLAAQKLIGLLKQINKNIEVVDVLETVEESINWFNHNSYPDLIFMDIQLNDGVCFEIFGSVKIDKPIVFTTAYDEYALQAFKVNSIDYLLKPVKLTDLRQAVNKFKSLYNQQNQNFDLEKVLKQLTPKYKERFFIKVGNHYKSILCNEINCFYISERSAFIYTSEGKSIGIDFSLERIEEMLNPDLFFRINRNMIVHINAIEDIISYSSSRLKLKIKKWNGDEDTLISRERVSKFKNWIDR